MPKKQIKICEIEEAIYGEGGAFERVVKKMDEMKMCDVAKITGKFQQSLDIFKRQFYHPEKYNYKPKFDSIKNIAEKLGVE